MSSLQKLSFYSNSPTHFNIKVSHKICKLFHVMVNVNLMVENVIQIKSGRKKCADVSAKIQ